MDLLTELYIRETTQLIGYLENKMSGQHFPIRLSIEDIHQIFRNIHTIKSSSAMMQNKPVTSLAHALEDLFEPMRSSHKEHAVDKDFAMLVIHVTRWLKDHLLPETIDRSSSRKVTNLIREINKIRVTMDNCEQMNPTVDVDQSVPLPYVIENPLNQSLLNLTREIQKVPLNETVMILNRLAEDIASSLGKKIHFIASGEEIELGSQMIHPVADSLTHLIRNAIDHGIESPEERLEQGKSEHGRLIVEVSQIGDMILISVEDDGRGLDPAMILERADQLRMLDRPAWNYSEAEAIELIFSHGLSTKTQITSISGRGVGLDAVKDLMQSLGGRVRVESVLGKRTRFALEIPRS